MLFARYGAVRGEFIARRASRERGPSTSTVYTDHPNGLLSRQLRLFLVTDSIGTCGRHAIAFVDRKNAGMAENSSQLGSRFRPLVSASSRGGTIPSQLKDNETAAFVVTSSQYPAERCNPSRRLETAVVRGSAEGKRVREKSSPISPSRTRKTPLFLSTQPEPSEQKRQR